MKRVLTFLLLFSVCFFASSLNSFAATTKSRNVYGINSISITDSQILINGWAYRTFTNFCNTDNSTYASYQMSDSTGKILNESSICSNRGYSSVVYSIKAVGDDGHVVFATNTSGGKNLRRQGTSATCVNYYKPTTSDGKSSIHCDGSIAPFGEFPSNPINYQRRNYNVQNYNKTLFSEGAYFYDDIGFAGKIDVSELKNDVSYTLYLDMTVNDKTYSFTIAAPGLVVSISGHTILNSKNDSKINVSSSEFNFVLNYSSNYGVINQDAGSVYVLSDSKFKQFSPSLGGGYFTKGLTYNIKGMIPFSSISVYGNRERIDSFDLYNLGTTGSFSSNYTKPGDDYSYYAMATWVSFSGKLVLIKTGLSTNKICNGTVFGTTARIGYCNQNPKPDDYNTCCECGGTLPDTVARATYCSKNSDNFSCCPSSGNCPPETIDKIDDIIPENYTFWDSSTSSDKESYYTNISKKTILNFPKYCTETDKTSTAFNNVLGMTLEYNNAFCYQVGGFTTVSDSIQSSDDKLPFSKYYITYSGGNYKLNVRYETELVCVSLDNREIIGISVKGHDGNCTVSNNLNDSDIKWNGEDTTEEPDDTFDYYDSKYYYNHKQSGCNVSCFDTPGGEHCEPTDGSLYLETVGEYDGDGNRSNKNICYSGFKKSSQDSIVTNGYTSSPPLNVSKEGKFDITSTEVLKNFENIPTLKVSDSTSNSKDLVFDVNLIKDYSNEKVSFETSYSNDSSYMKEYLNDNNISSPLNHESYSVFTKAITVKKYVAMYKPKTVICHYYHGDQASSKFIDSTYYNMYNCLLQRLTGKYSTYTTDPVPTEISYNEDNYSGTLKLKFVGDNNLIDTYKKGYSDSLYKDYINSDYKNTDINYNLMTYDKPNSKTRSQINLIASLNYFYEGWVEKTIYVTVKSNYKEQRIKLYADYSLPLSSVSDRFSEISGKWVSQINLSDYYQIKVDSTSHSVDSGNKFGVAETWNMDKALCALDLTDHDCDPSESTCACKYNGASLEKGVYYSECLDFRVVSTTSLFPGKGNYKCENPLRLCRQPGRNWSKYLETGLLSSNNIDYVKDKPMYHIVLTPSAMNNIINNNKDYYTNIDLTGYNPSKCTYVGDSRCSYDYWSTMLNRLDGSVFTRNYDIINLRYRQLKALGANEYKTSKVSSSGGE